MLLYYHSFCYVHCYMFRSICIICRVDCCIIMLYILHNSMQTIKILWLAATLHNQFFCRSRDSSVGIATAYELDDRVSIPGRIKRLFFIPRCPDWLWGPPNLLSNGYWWLFLQGLKRKGREADQSPSNAEVKNIGAIPQLPHTSS
jgi:hypothetical protein